MISLESRKQYFNVVISDLHRCKNRYSILLDAFNRDGLVYYAIVHDRDMSTQGELIRPHLHLCIRSLKRYRVKQLLSYMSEYLQCNVENIQIMNCDNFTACVQYLIHKNDISKYQYCVEDIITNDNENLIPILNETIVTDHLTTDRLFELVYSGCTRLEIIKSIGIGAYQHYRSTINDLLDMYSEDKSFNSRYDKSSH